MAKVLMLPTRREVAQARVLLLSAMASVRPHDADIASQLEAAISICDHVYRELQGIEFKKPKQIGEGVK